MFLGQQNLRDQKQTAVDKDHWATGRARAKSPKEDKYSQAGF